MRSSRAVGLPVIVIATREGQIVIVACLLPFVVWCVFTILYPVETRRWMIRYWSRLPENPVLPRYLDPAVLERSLFRRTMERMGALVMLAVLVVVFLCPLFVGK